MSIVETYSMEWQKILKAFTDFGFSKEDVQFCLFSKEHGGGFNVELSRKIFRLLGKVATSGEFHDVIESIEARPTHTSTVEVEIKNTPQLALFHGIIVITLDYLRNGSPKPKTRRDGQKICQEREIIREGAIRLSSVIPMKQKKLLDEPFLEKKTGVFVLRTDFGKGKKRITGKTPSEVLRKLEKYVAEIRD